MGVSTPISRRTVLRGLGAAMALPYLEAMAPSASLTRSASAAPAAAPRRMAFLFVPNGAHMPDWIPKEAGPLAELPPILKPLERHKEYLTVLSGLTLDGGRAHGDGPGDHARAVASFLTGAHPVKTDGKDIKNGPSVDQLGAKVIGHLTRFPSLELGVEPSAQGGRCDSGYSCVYTSNISWRTATSPMAKEINPRAVFDRLFGSGRSEEDQRAIAQRDARRKSILDFVAEDAGSLKRRLGAADQQKLDEYLFGVRQIERRINESEKLDQWEVDQPTEAARPKGLPLQFEEHVRLMMEMMVLALQTDSTRIITFMYTNAGSNRSYPDQGVRAGHHDLSHHGNDPQKQAHISTINVYHTTLLAHLVDRMRQIKEPGGTLLDNVMLMYGSGLADGNRHEHHNLPIILLGKGGGTIQPGRHLAYPVETPLTNLYLAMLERLGAPTAKMADSTGPLQGLG